MSNLLLINSENYNQINSVPDKRMKLLHKMQFYISVIGKVSERQASLAERPGVWKDERALLLTLLAPAILRLHTACSCMTDTMELPTLAHLCSLEGAWDSVPG